MSELGYVYVAYNKIQLENLLLKKDFLPLYSSGEYASEQLIQSISNFIKNNE
jgi:hypothetical protein